MQTARQSSLRFFALLMLGDCRQPARPTTIVSQTGDGQCSLPGHPGARDDSPQCEENYANAPNYFLIELESPIGSDRNRFEPLSMPSSGQLFESIIMTSLGGRPSATPIIERVEPITKWK